MMTADLIACDRRNFLKMACRAMVGAAILGGPLGAAQALAAANRHTVRQTRLLMGTMASITVAAPDQSLANHGINAAFAEMERLIAVFDRRNPATALGSLNAGGVLRDAPRDLLLVLEQARQLWRATETAFNPAIAPALELMEAARRDGRDAPDGRALAEAMELADFSAVRAADGAVALERQGMSLTLDGMAKGYIADAAARVLRERGLPDHLVDAGGDLRIGGFARPEQRAQGAAARWTVGIQHPFSPGKIIESLPAGDCGLATSGNYENYFNKSRSSHHIVSPHTGQSPDVASVTVRAPDAARADALATALALMPPGKALAHVRGQADAACLIIDRQGRRYSENWG